MTTSPKKPRGDNVLLRRLVDSRVDELTNVVDAIPRRAIAQVAGRFAVSSKYGECQEFNKLCDKLVADLLGIIEPWRAAQTARLTVDLAAEIQDSADFVRPADSLETTDAEDANGNGSDHVKDLRSGLDGPAPGNHKITGAFPRKVFVRFLETQDFALQKSTTPDSRYRHRLGAQLFVPQTDPIHAPQMRKFVRALRTILQREIVVGHDRIEVVGELHCRNRAHV